MGRFSLCSILLISVLFLLNIQESFQHLSQSVDDLANHISPEDLSLFMKSLSDNDFAKGKEDLTLKPAGHRRARRASKKAANPGKLKTINQVSTTSNSVPEKVQCFGPLTERFAIFDTKPGSSDAVNTHFYFYSRKMNRTQVLPGPKFSLKSVDFKPKRKTVMIIHGFLSYSDASWVQDMAQAFLKWGDVNVIAVDWSAGGNAFRYLKAVANTRTVGQDIDRFMRQMKATAGLKKEDVHIVGHSLGAHIASYASNLFGKVARITGLDPAQPCYMTTDPTMRLDSTDADYVDIIHTNGRMLSKLGLGYPDPDGHDDFYPNGGMRQPGCEYVCTSIWEKLKKIILCGHINEAICNHGRSYLLFTQSLLNRDCIFKGHNWDLTYEGVNSSLKVDCTRPGSCSEMGIGAVGTAKTHPAKGCYFVLTTDKEPFCPTDLERRLPQDELLKDLKNGHVLNGLKMRKTKRSITQTTPSSWFGFPKLRG